MKPGQGTYTIDTNRVIEHRLRARVVLIVVFFGIYMLFLAGSMFDKDSRTAVTITNYISGALFLLLLLVCLFFSSRAERTVIVITENSVKRIVDGGTTNIILLDEIGELKEFSRGFLIVKKGTSIPDAYFSRSNFEHVDFPGVIYVPEVMSGYWDIYNFVRRVLKSHHV